MQGQYHQQPPMHPVQQGGYGGQQHHQQMMPPPPSQQQYYQQQQQQQPGGVYAQPPLSPGAYGSHPTLPRYASQTSMGGPASPSLSPLNPSAQRGGPSPTNSYTSSQPSSAGTNYSNGGNPNNNGLGSRFSSYGYGNGGPGAQGGAHPLSHALYADSPSSPTLAGDMDDSISDEKKGLASFPPSSSASSGGDSRSSNNRRMTRGQQQSHRNHEGGLGGAYKRWSGAFIADSGVDESHRKQDRVGWLDGLRFFAAWLVINGTFFDATIGNSDVSAVCSHRCSSVPLLTVIPFPTRYSILPALLASNAHLPSPLIFYAFHINSLRPHYTIFISTIYHPLFPFTEILCHSKKLPSIHFQIIRYRPHFLPYDSR